MHLLQLSTLTLLLLTTAARAELRLEDVRPAYGPLGPNREDKELVIHPGEEFYLRYNVVGAKPDGRGAIDLEIETRILDADGKEIIRNSNPVRGVIALGGDKLPASARATLGQMITEGKYQINVTVTDRPSNQTASFSKEVTVKKTDKLALINRRFFYDAEGRVPAPVGGVVGQPLHFRMQLVGFDRSQSKIRTRMEMQVLDAEGKEQMPKPITVRLASDEPKQVERADALTFRGSLSLNRPGTFKLRYRFVDEVGNQELTFETPLIVRE